ncbi:MAG: M15 family metallopeptidase [Spirochaetales bacterium]|nr:M15 family metallopeptidase [Spirochaetales bacterium]
MKKINLKDTIFIIVIAVFAILAFILIPALPRLFSQNNRGETDHMIAKYKEILINHPDFPLRAEKDFITVHDNPNSGQINGEDLKQKLLELEENTFRQTCGNVTDPALRAELSRYKTFSGNGFKNFYNALTMPGTTPLSAAPFITEWPEADKRIVGIATERGYRLRAEADESLLTGEGKYTLHEAALQAWESMKAAALKDGISLELVSCYRSVDRQRVIFLGYLKRGAGKLLGREYILKDFLNGRLDGVIDDILKESSIPGFSRHHTGYTMDITDGDLKKDFTFFRESKGYEWISAYNYYHAKRFGFIPSYPEGATSQGPDPEAWEFTWVGPERLQWKSLN